MEIKDGKTGEIMVIDTEAYKRINIEESMPCPLELKIENLTDEDISMNPFYDGHLYWGIKLTKYRNKENKTSLKNIKEIKFQSDDFDKFWYKTFSYASINGNKGVLYQKPFCTLIDPYQSINKVAIAKFTNTINPETFNMTIPARCSVTISAFEGDELQNTEDFKGSDLTSILITNKTSEKIEVDAFKQVDSEKISVKYICGKYLEDFSIALTGIYCQSNSSQVIQQIKVKTQNETNILEQYIDPYQMTSNLIIRHGKIQKTKDVEVIYAILPHTTVLLNFWGINNTETNI